MSYNVHYTIPTARQNRYVEGLDLAQNEVNMVNPPNVNIYPPPNWQREDVTLGSSASATIFRAPGIRITTSSNPRPRTNQNISIITSQPGHIVMTSENPYPSNSRTSTGTSEYPPVVSEALSTGFSIEQIENAMSRQILREGQVHLTLASLIDDIMVHTEESPAQIRTNSIEPAAVQQTIETREQAPSSSQHEIVPAASRCFVCDSEPVEILFLPCAHLVTCSFCSPLLQYCPACQAQIKRWIKVKQVHET